MNPDARVQYAFFGSSRFSVIVLDELEKLGIVPAYTVSTPDKPVGRKLTLTPNPVKIWAESRGIPCLTPAKLDDACVTALRERGNMDFYVVASYGRIIPGQVIDMPRYKTLNIHPSLLPHYRGASPLQSAMLADDKHTGVTIMRIDEQMDHGPIVSQNEVAVSEWPTYEEFEETMARKGAHLLTETMQRIALGERLEREQDHTKATYTKKTTKEDGLLDLSGDQYLAFRKIQAYHQWPQAYFMHTKDSRQLRIKVTAASFRDKKLVIEKVIPEGGKEMTLKDFESGYGKIAMR